MPEIPVPKPRAGKTQDSEDEEEDDEKKETKEKDKKKDKKKGGGCRLELLELLEVVGYLRQNWTYWS